MTTCDRYRSWMVERLYEELDAARRAEFDAHAGECAACAALMSELETTAQLMNRRRRPDPGPEFWEGFGRRLEQRVARGDSVFVDASRFARRRSLGSWGYRVAAVLAVLAAGVWIGRTAFSPSPQHDAFRVATSASPGDSTPRPNTDHRGGPGLDDGAIAPERAREDESFAQAIDAPPSEQSAARQPSADAGLALVPGDDAAQRYLERSQLLLFAVLNGDGGGSASFDEHRRRAGELVQAASSVREGSNDRRVQELVAQLELILREIAHLEEGSDVDAVELIRGRVDREGVLLRINLAQMRAVPTAPAKADGAID